MALVQRTPEEIEIDGACGLLDPRVNLDSDINLVDELKSCKDEDYYYDKKDDEWVCFLTLFEIKELKKKEK